MGGIDLGLYPYPRLCDPLTLLTNYGLLCMVSVSSLWSFSRQFLTSLCHLPPTSCPPTPLATLAQNWCAPPSEMAQNQASKNF